MVEQLTIYNELGHMNDPVYEQLSLMNKEYSINIAGLAISKNQYGLYEISDVENHECSSTLLGCYHKVKDIIGRRENNEGAIS